MLAPRCYSRASLCRNAESHLPNMKRHVAIFGSEASMQSPDDWQIPLQFQPDPSAYSYDLDRALDAVVSLRARVPETAFTAETLGVDRAGRETFPTQSGSSRSSQVPQPLA